MGIRRTLTGKRIVVTRVPEQARNLIAALEELGAEVVLLPMIALAPPEDSQDLDEQLRQLDSFDAIVFLSANAVRFIFDRCAQLGIQCAMLLSSDRVIGAVGPATARALKEKRVRVHCVAEKGTGETLARQLGPSLSGRRVLLPRSDRGDERVADALRTVGARVTEVIAYRTTDPATVDPDILARARGGGVDAIVFASPSAVRNFTRVIGEADLPELSARVPFLAIGPTTATAIRSSGACVRMQAEESSTSGIVKVLVRHFAHHPIPARRP